VKPKDALHLSTLAICRRDCPLDIDIPFDRGLGQNLLARPGSLKALQFVR